MSRICKVNVLATCEATNFVEVLFEEPESIEIAIETQLALILLELFGGPVSIEEVTVDYIVCDDIVS